MEGIVCISPYDRVGVKLCRLPKGRRVGKKPTPVFKRDSVEIKKDKLIGHNRLNRWKKLPRDSVIGRKALAVSYSSEIE